MHPQFDLLNILLETDITYQNKYNWIAGIKFAQVHF